MGVDEDRTLGEIVLRRGYISLEQLHLLLMESEKTHRPLAALLLKQALLTQEQLDEVLERMQNPSEDTSTMDAVPVTGPTPVPPPPPPVRIGRPPARAARAVPPPARKGRSGVFIFTAVLLALGGGGAAFYFYLWPHLAPPEPPPPPPPSEKLAGLFFEEESTEFQAQLEKSLAFDPDDPEAHYWAARAALRDLFRTTRLRAPNESFPQDSPASMELRTRARSGLAAAAAHASRWETPQRMAVVEGLRHLLTGNPADGAHALGAAAGESSDDPEIPVYLALALYLDGRFEQAASSSARPSTRLARVVHARACLGIGTPEKLEAGLAMLPKEKTVDVATAEIELKVALEAQRREAGDAADADRLLAEALALADRIKNDPEGFGSLAMAFEAQARIQKERGQAETVASYQRAIDLYSRAAAEGQPGPPWRLRWASAMIDLGRHMAYRGRTEAVTIFKDAETELRRHGGAESKSLAAWASSRQALLRATKPLDVVQTYERLIAQLGETPHRRAEAHLELARFQGRRGADWSQPLQAALADAGSSPLAAEILLERATQKSLRSEDPIPDAQAAIEGSRDLLLQGDAWGAIAEAKSRANQDSTQEDDSAIECYKKKAEARPGSAAALSRLAEAHVARGRRRARRGEDPSPDFVQALALAQDGAKNRVESAELLLAGAEARLEFAARKRVEADLMQAIKEATAASEISPPLARCSIVKAMARIQLGILHSRPPQSPESDIAAALEDLSRAMTLAENDVDALWQRGRAALVMAEFRFSRTQDPSKDVASALQDLTSALRIRKQDPFISRDRSRVHSIAGQYALKQSKKDVESFRRCAEDATAALSQAQTDASLWFDRGRARFYVDQFQGAIEDLEQAKRLDPALTQPADTIINLAKLALQHGGR